MLYYIINEQKLYEIHTTSTASHVYEIIYAEFFFKYDIYSLVKARDTLVLIEWMLKYMLRYLQ